LTQLAAATAANGTSLPTIGGIVLVKAFNPRAVTSAPLVASTYDVPSCVFVMGEFPDLLE